MLANAARWQMVLVIECCFDIIPDAIEVLGCLFDLLELLPGDGGAVFGHRLALSVHVSVVAPHIIAVFLEMSDESHPTTRLCTPGLKATQARLLLLLLVASSLLLLPLLVKISLLLLPLLFKISLVLLPLLVANSLAVCIHRETHRDEQRENRCGSGNS